MTAGTFLRGLERTLLAVGLALGIWCGAVLLDAHFVAKMPTPNPPKATETSASTPAARPSPVTGAWVARLTRRMQLSQRSSKAATIKRSRGAGRIEHSISWSSRQLGIAGHRDTTFRAVRNRAGRSLSRLPATGSTAINHWTL